jgi:hypothetical protein
VDDEERFACADRSATLPPHATQRAAETRNYTMKTVNNQSFWPVLFISQRLIALTCLSETVEIIDVFLFTPLARHDSGGVPLAVR